MKVLGISLNHDAAVSVISNDHILFASHSERYSRIKNDSHLNDALIEDALLYGQPDIIAYYERPWIKKTRQLYAQQWSEVFNLNSPRKQIRKWFPKSEPKGLCIIAGEVSGDTDADGTIYGLEFLDVDDTDILEQFIEQANWLGISALLERLPYERTPRDSRRLMSS